MRQLNSRHRFQKPFSLLRNIIFCSLVAAVCVPFATGQPSGPLQNPEPKQSQASSESADATQKYFTDVELVNQDGQTMRLYSDVLKGNVVVINCFYTTCTGSCPALSANLEKIQDSLADQLGKNVLLVSITVDPLTDTPPKLKEYAQKFHAKPGRFFLTGKKENVDLALKKLGMAVAEKKDHATLFVIGNVPTGLWKKAFGLAKAEELISLVQSVINDKAK
jgi:protein SCO1/2